MDDWHIGIRHTGDYAIELLDRVLPGARIEDSHVPDNYSVALYPPKSGKASRDLHLLVRGSQTLVRSRSAARVLRGLLTYLSLDLFPRDPDLLTIQMTPLVHDGEAIIVPGDIGRQRQQAEPRLARIGYRMVDLPYALVDPATGELVVPDPQIPYDTTALADLERAADLGRELPAVAPGRYPITAWLLGTTEDNTGPITTARAVASLFPSFSRESAAVDALVTMITGLLADSPVRGISYESIPEFGEALQRHS